MRQQIFVLKKKSKFLQ